MELKTLNPTNRKTSSLIDSIGFLDAEIAEIRARREKLAKVLKSRGDGSFDGDLFSASISTSTSYRLDRKALLHYVTAAVLETCSKPVTATTLKIKARTISADAREKVAA